MTGPFTACEQRYEQTLRRVADELAGYERVEIRNLWDGLGLEPSLASGYLSTGRSRWVASLLSVDGQRGVEIAVPERRQPGCPSHSRSFRARRTARLVSR